MSKNRLEGKHICIACGGTGGHFFPTLAIADIWQRQGGVVTLLVSGHHASDHLRLARERGFAARELPAPRFSKTSAFAVNMARAVLAGRRLVKELSPDLFLGMGSFASVPACLAAVWCRTPLYLHESNAWMGRANRLLSRWAVHAGIGLPLEETCPCRCPITSVGTPLRDALLKAVGTSMPEGFLAELGLRADTPTVLVFGGSQGAEAVNGLMASTAGVLGRDASRLQVIHLTGTEENADFVDAYAAAGLRASVRRADYSIENCYLAADLVICRAGAGTLAELALFGKPAILIPLPTAAEDHQTCNARVLERLDAARRLCERDTTPEMLANLLRDWLEGPAPWQEMGTRVRTLARPQAAEAMVDLLASSPGTKMNSSS